MASEEELKKKIQMTNKLGSYLYGHKDGYNQALEDVKKELQVLIGFHKSAQKIANELVGFTYNHLEELKKSEGKE